MGILDKLARAEVSSDLKHYDRPCDVDTLTAAGMSAIGRSPHYALFRLKYLADPESLPEAKRIAIRWAYASLLRRGLNSQQANREGVQCLMAWLDDVCKPCGGTKFQQIIGTPALSDKPCPHCNGTGRTILRRSGEMLEVWKDVHERADGACLAIQRGMAEKIGGR